MEASLEKYSFSQSTFIIIRVYYWKIYINFFTEISNTAPQENEGQIMFVKRKFSDFRGNANIQIAFSFGCDYVPSVVSRMGRSIEGGNTSRSREPQRELGEIQKLLSPDEAGNVKVNARRCSNSDILRVTVSEQKSSGIEVSV